MEIINNDNFDKTINSGEVLIDFYADWCGPCRMLSPILENIDKENIISIKKVNVDESIDIARKYGVMTIPTLILFRNGTEIKRNVGLMSKDQIIEFINK